MELITGPTLSNVNELKDPAALYEKLMKVVYISVGARVYKEIPAEGWKSLAGKPAAGPAGHVKTWRARARQVAPRDAPRLSGMERPQRGFQPPGH